MIAFLKALDIQLLLFINGLHQPLLDKVMLFLTYKYTWIPLYVGIIFFIFVKKRKEYWLVLLFIIGAVICSDLVASSLMKPYFQRLRPCHNLDLNTVLYLVGDLCGGRFGFVSSHAANTFALATFFYLYVGREYNWIEVFFIWAGFVSLSRVYLGVHYPADIAVGALLGIVVAIVFYSLFKQAQKRLFH